MFTDLATGRRIIVPATEDTDEWWAEFPELVIGHTYLVQLVTNAIAAVEFYPYELSGVGFVADATLVDGVNVEIVKVWEVSGDTYYSAFDQWVSI